MKINKLSFYVFFALIGLLQIISGCGNANNEKRQGIQSAVNAPKAYFDWFVYKGNDPVYHDYPKNDDEYYNPIISGFYPDPSITRAGDDYYMVHSSFSYYPGIPIFKSGDLVNWEQIGHVLDRPSQLNLDGLGMSRGVFAPTIQYNGQDETFYVLNTLVDAGGNFLVTAKDPEGPWSDPVWLPELDGIDPSIFFDNDGKAYIVHNGPPNGEPKYEGHRAIWMWEYDKKAQKVVGDGKVIVDGGVDISQQPIWIEAPHIMKVGGEYLLSAAEGGTGPEHSQVVFKSNSIWGPYLPWNQNPILTQRTLNPDREYPVAYTGHADMVETQNGEWWAIFLGVRPYEEDYFNTGRETYMLPVHWKDGWPVILEDGKTVPFVIKKPDLPEQTTPKIPLNGNFELREDFDGPNLAHYWNFIRTPRENWYDLESKPGMLGITARPYALYGKDQPSFIGRRQQHQYATASTAMFYKPEKKGDAAGLVAFQGEEFYYFLKVTMGDAGEEIQLEKRAGELANHASEIIASAPISEIKNQPIYLKIEAKGRYYDFYYGFDKDDWKLLKENADGRILSTQVAGGFVGTMFGMYAYSEN